MNTDCAETERLARKNEQNKLQRLLRVCLWSCRFHRGADACRRKAGLKLEHIVNINLLIAQQNCQYAVDDIFK